MTINPVFVNMKLTRKTIVGMRNLTSDTRKLCLIQPVTAMEVIQKSKFIVSITPMNSLDTALQYLDQEKDVKANHNCWAYRGSSECEYRFSDDGEPAGTAGKPILTALESLNVYNTMVIVTRYFGGIKLGTGGLQRAYQGVTKRCLETAIQENLCIESFPQIKVEVIMPMDQFRRSYGLIRKYGMISTETTATKKTFHSEQVIFSIVLKKDALESFQQLLQNLSKGQTEVKLVDMV